MKAQTKKAHANGGPAVKTTAMTAPAKHWGEDSGVSTDFGALKKLAQSKGSTLRESVLLRKDGKQKLVGKPFIVTSIRVKNGSFGNPVARISGVLESGRSFVMHDGSTGIFRQLVGDDGELTVALPLFVPGGLRASSYEYTAPDGSTGPATTYYLAGEQDVA